MRRDDLIIPSAKLCEVNGQLAFKHQALLGLPVAVGRKGCARLKAKEITFGFGLAVDEQGLLVHPVSDFDPVAFGATNGGGAGGRQTVKGRLDGGKGRGRGINRGHSVRQHLKFGFPEPYTGPGSGIVSQIFLDNFHLFDGKRAQNKFRRGVV